MKNIKKNIFLFLSLILFFSLPIKVNANNKVIKYDTAEKYSYEKDNISAFGTYPIISNLKDKTFEKDINKQINNIINKTLSSKKQNVPKKIDISYKTFLSENILSILLYFKDTTTKEETIKSIVIDIENSKKLSLNSFLGPNGIAYANKVVISKSDELGLKSTKVTEDTAFYVENGKLFIIYGAGEITFVQKGNIVIQLNPKNIQNYTIYEKSYYIKSNYNVKMVPLREPLEALGYKIIWDSKTNAIAVNSSNGEFISYLKINENKYSKGSLVARPLEFAPEVKNGITYVPISFFSDIIGLLYSTNSSKNIVISKYLI